MNILERARGISIPQLKDITGMNPAQLDQAPWGAMENVGAVRQPREAGLADKEDARCERGFISMAE